MTNVGKFRVLNSWGMILRYQLLLSTSLVLLLSACGGGGGGASSSPGAGASLVNDADGLGRLGHATGTMDLGKAALPGATYGGTPKIAIALSDQGRALAVWQVTAAGGGEQEASWTQFTTTSTFGEPQALPQARNSSIQFGLTLRMNAAGNAVLGWVNQEREAPSTDKWGYKTARFIQGAGWDAQAYDAGGGSSSSTFGSTSAWDLTMLDDDSFTTSVRVSGSSGYTSAVLRNNRQGQPSLNLKTGDHNEYYPYAAFSTKPNGYGLFYQLSDSAGGSGQVDIKAQIADVYSSAFSAFPIGSYRGLCYTPSYDSPLVAAITPQVEGVLTVLAADAVGCRTHNLQLHRVYTAGSIRVDSTRLNAPATFLPVSPVVAVDRLGNALAVWKESTGHAFDESVPSTTRLMWSRSSYGGAWSIPAVVDLGALGTVPRSGHISLAMNMDGKAVASVIVNGLDGSSLNQSIAIGRFTFASGWTAWETIANKANLSEPQVAINTTGQAVLAYTALAVPRVGGKAPTSFGGEPPVRAFAYWF